MWSVYLLLCSDSSYYIGISPNVAQRFLDHKRGKGGAYTRSHPPVKILYTEAYPDRSSALKREAQLKTWSKAKKAALISDGSKSMITS